jgi:hypothetical protein
MKLKTSGRSTRFECVGVERDSRVVLQRDREMAVRSGLEPVALEYDAARLLHRNHVALTQTERPARRTLDSTRGWRLTECGRCRQEHAHDHARATLNDWQRRAFSASSRLASRPHRRPRGDPESHGGLLAKLRRKPPSHVPGGSGEPSLLIPEGT